jgi:hypothetical protein
MRSVLLIVFAGLLLLTADPFATLASRSLTGFYATRAAFATHRVRDPNTTPGSAFLPRLPHGGDHIALVTYDHGRVDSFELSYDPRVSFTAAQVEVRGELPPDSVLTFDVRKSECEMFQYRSPIVARLEGPNAKALFGKSKGPRGLIDVTFYSSEVTAPYTRRWTGNVMFGLGLNANDRKIGC